LSRESQAEDAIIAPEEGSEEATVASSQDAPEELADKGFDAHLEDNFDGIDWTRLPKYMKPVAESRQRKSWIYLYGFRVALLKDPNRIYFVCRYCHERKFIDAGCGGIFETTRAVSAAARHLMEQRPGHSHQAPGKSAVAIQESLLH
jgi:hypothetical protein